MSLINQISHPVDSYLKARKAYQNALDANKGIKPNSIKNNVEHSINGADNVKDNIGHASVNTTHNIKHHHAATLNNGVSEINFKNNINVVHNGNAKFSFSDFFEKLSRDRIRKIKRSEAQINAAVEGNASAIEVMAAISESEVALQEIVLIRDKIIGAYQEILRMSL